MVAKFMARRCSVAFPALDTVDTVEPVAASAARWGADVNLCQHLIFRHVEEGRGEAPALHYQDRTFCYADVAALTRRMATLYKGFGVKAGDRIALVLPDSPVFVGAFFAAALLGAVAVPLHPQLPATDACEILRRLGAKLLLLDESKIEQIGRDLADAVVVCGDTCNRIAELERLLAEVPVAEPSPVNPRGAEAYCLFSSGTTGRPKGIPHRHTDILHCIESYCIPTLQMTSSDRVLAVPKLSFGYGLGGNLLAAFYVGGASILVPAPSTGATMLQAARQFAPTLFLAQPRALGELLQLDLRSGFGSLRLAVTAGEILVPTLYERWRQAMNVELLDGFGTTEVGHVFISNTIGDVVPGSAGRVLPPFEVKLLDEAGNPVAEDEIGHLWVRGPSLSPGYLDEPERTAASFVDGWVRTGDLASRRACGAMAFAGRADEMIKAGCGEWVAPTELEDIIQSHPAIVEVAVVGTSDPLGLVTPKAYVVLGSATTPSVALVEEIKELVIRRWPELRHKHLSSVEFVGALPRTSSGKLRRFMLQPVTLTEFSYDCAD